MRFNGSELWESSDMVNTLFLPVVGVGTGVGRDVVLFFATDLFFCASISAAGDSDSTSIEITVVGIAGTTIAGAAGFGPVGVAIVGAAGFVGDLVDADGAAEYSKYILFTHQL